jgi:hypothetical protein
VVVPFWARRTVLSPSRVDRWSSNGERDDLDAEHGQVPAGEDESAGQAAHHDGGGPGGLGEAATGDRHHGLLGPEPGEVSGDGHDATKQRRDATSPDDVIHRVDARKLTFRCRFRRSQEVKV